MEAKATQEDKPATEVAKEGNVPAKEEVEGAPVAPGTNIAGSIEKMEHQIAILNKELEKIRAKLVEARKEEIENSTDEAKRYGAICILRQTLRGFSHSSRSKIAELVKEKKRIKALIQFQGKTSPSCQCRKLSVSLTDMQRPL